MFAWSRWITQCVRLVCPCHVPCLLCSALASIIHANLLCWRDSRALKAYVRECQVWVGMGMDPPGRDWLTGQRSREDAHKSWRKNKEIFGHSHCICVVHLEARAHCMLWHCPRLFCCWWGSIHLLLSLPDPEDERHSLCRLSKRTALRRLPLPRRERQPARVFHPIPLISSAKIPCLQKAI